MTNAELRFAICWSVIILGLLALGTLAVVLQSVGLWVFFAFCVMYTFMFQESKIRSPIEPEPISGHDFSVTENPVTNSGQADVDILQGR